MKISNCPCCQSTNHRLIAEFPNMPVLCNQLFDNEADALDARCGDISVVVCESCGLIWNRAFDASRLTYEHGYENALHYSPKFRQYAEALVADLVKHYDLRGKTVVEIGCGDGYILDLFAKHGVASAVGFDPSMEGRTSSYLERDGVEIHASPFNTDSLTPDIDFVVCRHVLEHLETPDAFIASIASVLGERSVPLFFEVPNAEWILSAPSPWDLIYEHVTYWAETSLRALFRNAGFKSLATSQVYGRQFLTIEAQRTGDSSRVATNAKDAARLVQAADAFAENLDHEMTRWSRVLDSTEGKVAIWGAGSKGITFANLFAGCGRGIDAMVDLNPRKHNRFVPGTGTPVLSPSDLRELAPALLLVANGRYLEEIKDRAREEGLDVRVEAIAD